MVLALTLNCIYPLPDWTYPYPYLELTRKGIESILLTLILNCTVHDPGPLFLSWSTILVLNMGNKISTAKLLFWLCMFSRKTQPKVFFGCGVFKKWHSQNFVFGCGGFASTKKMAVEKLKSHFGCGICPDPYLTVKRSWKYVTISPKKPSRSHWFIYIQK